MFLLIRLFNIDLIRHYSSSSREFYATLKKSYRSTKLNLFMASNNRTCFIFDKDDSTKILIQMVYEIPSTKIRRQFNLLRSVDESLSQTIHRLKSNIERAIIKENKLNKPVIKYSFPDNILTNTTRTAFLDIDYGDDDEYSLFDMYVADYIKR
ncbi:unnamed protein product [Rotaria sordida]|uniref:Uncharacterized protein n=2 Tax=Rotaria sordida TaxID=392033 RepID=A0A814CI92_9BILA|nr:unnamed protein product [Rotaria sordida]CAF0920962.1 unnamed protein product [Rotaria sordida]CAF0939918.1 unnamed protein product [Rotaria sordida]CAF0940597.1 unnamed protein product [Rotaria sordida]